MDFYKESNHPALYYQGMLSDERRMVRFRTAIDAVVQPGDVVVDLGTGLGVLAIMAARAGAEHVYAVDIRPQVMSIAERIIAANGFREKISLICSDAMDVELPRQVDVIVNELIGDFGTDENIYECVRSVADRYLKDGGRIMPNRLSTRIVGVTYDRELRGVFGDDVHDMDLSSAVTDAFTPPAIIARTATQACGADRSFFDRANRVRHSYAGASVRIFAHSAGCSNRRAAGIRWIL